MSIIINECIKTQLIPTENWVAYYKTLLTEDSKHLIDDDTSAESCFSIPSLENVYTDPGH